mgnify:FL=1|jgi:hypothetical protein
MCSLIELGDKSKVNIVYLEINFFYYGNILFFYEKIWVFVLLNGNKC